MVATAAEAYLLVAGGIGDDRDSTPRHLRQNRNLGGITSEWSTALFYEHHGFVLDLEIVLRAGVWRI